MRMLRVLFVCTGNICRSPTAQGVFQQLVTSAGLTDQVAVDSAGTHDYHVGRPPDLRAIQVAARHGVDLSALRARCVDPSDFDNFDYIIAMDRHNLAYLQAMAPQASNIYLLLSFDSERRDAEVPDPYYGDEQEFERVFNLLASATQQLLTEIRHQRQH